MPTLAFGIGLMALALGCMVFVSSIAGLLVCVGLLALGGLIASPVQQTIVARMADPRALGSYFGINGLAVAFGGARGGAHGGGVGGAAGRRARAGETGRGPAAARPAPQLQVGLAG